MRAPRVDGAVAARIAPGREKIMSKRVIRTHDHSSLTSQVSHRQMAAAARWRGAVLAAAALAGSPSAIFGSVSYTGGTYIENFDTLLNSGSVGGQFPTPLGTQASIPGLTAWDGAKVAGNSTAMSFFANAGGSATGALYSFGSAASERALGAVASGTSVGAFGVQIVNNSAFTITSFSLSFTAEQWRSSNSAQNFLNFAYGSSGGSISPTDYLSNNGMTAFTALNAPSKAPAASSTATDGNDPLNQTAVSATVFGVSIPVGGSLFLRWADVDDSGNDAGIGIDGLHFTAFAGGRNLTWRGTGGNWNTNPGNQNWLDGANPTAFANADATNFTDSGLTASTVTVDAGGVLAGAINVSNTSGTYTFQGGAIDGGALIKTGAGSLVLNNSNTYAGGTTINGGVVSISSDANLGNAVGGITLGGGTLRTAGNVNSTRPVALTASTASTIQTAGNSSTFGSVSGGGDLLIAGGGSVTISGAYNTTGLTSLAGGSSLVLGQNAGSVNLATGTSGSDFTGNLVVANGIRVNANAGAFSGGGQIRFQSTGGILSTNGTGLSSTIGNNIALNSNNVAPPFSTTIGATAGNTITIDGVISGNSDVSFSSSTPGAGTGLIVLNNHNTYTGSTTMHFASAGVVRLGIDNALPTTTDMIFGSGAINVGAFDLNGHQQTVRSLATATTGTANGIVNTAASRATLIINGNASTTYAGTIGIPANVTNLPGANDDIALVLSSAHTGALVLSGTNTYTGGTTVNGGVLSVSSDTNLGAATGSVALGGGTLLTTGSINTSRAIVASTAGSRGTIDTGASNVTLTTGVTGPGVFGKAGAGVLEVRNVRTGGLDVLGGSVKISATPAPLDPTNLSTVGVLHIAGGPTAPTAQIDITNNGLIASSVPLAGPEADVDNCRSYVQSGYNSGAWGGNGITTSANDFVNNHHGIGYATAGSIGISQFLGTNVQPTDIVIRWARFGDANLDGIVNLNDFNRLASNFGQSGKVWATGDFNYDGIVNLGDFNLLASNFGLSAGADGIVDPQDWAALASAVPEPGAASLLLLGGTASLRRRVRRSIRQVC
jgi:autotransporter-associated beta strand protein